MESLVRRVRQRSMKSIKLRQMQMPVLPTLLTLGNGICGLGSATYAMQASPAGGRSLLFAGLLIFAAMIFDMLDGGAARLMRQATRFGAELDSLCDAVSFGVAPALIIMQIADGYHSRILWAIAALYLACTVLRLARFNVETPASEHHDWFSGLPSPAAAATIASLAMIAANEPSLMLPDAVRQMLPDEAGLLRAVRNAVPIVAVIIAGLMVSRVRYPHIVAQLFRSRQRFQQVAQVVFAIAAIIALGAWAAPLILCTFVLASPLRAAWQRWTRPPRKRPLVNPPAQPAARLPRHAERSEPLAEARPARLRLWWPARKGRRRRGA